MNVTLDIRMTSFTIIFVIKIIEDQEIKIPIAFWYIENDVL